LCWHELVHAVADFEESLGGGSTKTVFDCGAKRKHPEIDERQIKVGRVLRDGVTIEFVGDHTKAAKITHVNPSSKLSANRNNPTDGDFKKPEKPSKKAKSCGEYIVRFCKEMRVPQSLQDNARSMSLLYASKAVRSNKVLAAAALYNVFRQFEYQPQTMPNVTHEAMAAAIGVSKSAVQRCSCEMKRIVG